MGERNPQPLGLTRVDDNWIDEDTTCRSRATKPGPIGLDPTSVALNAAPLLNSPFDRKQVGLKATEKARKVDISPILMKSPVYRALLEAQTNRRPPTDASS
jgi:hypothetical protein